MDEGVDFPDTVHIAPESYPLHDTTGVVDALIPGVDVPIDSSGDGSVSIFWLSDYYIDIDGRGFYFSPGRENADLIDVI